MLGRRYTVHKPLWRSAGGGLSAVRAAGPRTLAAGDIVTMPRSRARGLVASGHLKPTDLEPCAECLAADTDREARGLLV